MLERLRKEKMMNREHPGPQMADCKLNFNDGAH